MDKEIKEIKSIKETIMERDGVSSEDIDEMMEELLFMVEEEDIDPEDALDEIFDLDHTYMPDLQANYLNKSGTKY